MTKDWRLENLENYPQLRGVAFARKPYREFRPGWDHDHCVGCWVKLAEPHMQGPDIIHEGYVTTKDYVHGEDAEWACAECFRDFAAVMDWRDVTATA
jgi:hypothetical protein